jgi:hypothetical protein
MRGEKGQPVLGDKGISKKIQGDVRGTRGEEAQIDIRTTCLRGQGNK